MEPVSTASTALENVNLNGAASGDQALMLLTRKSDDRQCEQEKAP